MTPYQKKMNQFHETRRLRAELAREKRVKAMLNDQIDLLKSEAKELAFWLMHPLMFVHERIVSDVDKVLKPYLRDNSIT